MKTSNIGCKVNRKEDRSLQWPTHYLYSDYIYSVIQHCKCMSNAQIQRKSVCRSNIKVLNYFLENSSVFSTYFNQYNLIHHALVTPMGGLLLCKEKQRSGWGVGKGEVGLGKKRKEMRERKLWQGCEINEKNVGALFFWRDTIIGVITFCFYCLFLLLFVSIILRHWDCITKGLSWNWHKYNAE